MGSNPIFPVNIMPSLFSQVGVDDIDRIYLDIFTSIEIEIQKLEH